MERRWKRRRGSGVNCRFRASVRHVGGTRPGAAGLASYSVAAAFRLAAFSVFRGLDNTLLARKRAHSRGPSADQEILCTADRSCCRHAVAWVAGRPLGYAALDRPVRSLVAVGILAVRAQVAGGARGGNQLLSGLRRSAHDGLQQSLDGLQPATHARAARRGRAGPLGSGDRGEMEACGCGLSGRVRGSDHSGHDARGGGGRCWPSRWLPWRLLHLDRKACATE